MYIKLIDLQLLLNKCYVLLLLDFLSQIIKEQSEQ